MKWLRRVRTDPGKTRFKPLTSPTPCHPTAVLLVEQRLNFCCSFSCLFLPFSKKCRFLTLLCVSQPLFSIQCLGKVSSVIFPVYLHINFYLGMGTIIKLSFPKTPKEDMMHNIGKGPLCNLRTMRALISLRICVGWTGPSLPAYRINGYCSIWQKKQRISRSDCTDVHTHLHHHSSYMA